MEILERRRTHAGFLRLDMITLRHERFDGRTTGVLNRELLVQRAAVAVVPWDPHRDVVVLVEQFRAGLIDTPDAWSMEAPAGLIDGDEPPEEAARREVQEETGLRAVRIEAAGLYHSSPGASTEAVRCFVAEVTAPVEGGLFGVAGEDEDIRTVVLPRMEAMAAIDDGRLTAANTLIPLAWLDRQRDRLHRAWLADAASAG